MINVISRILVQFRTCFSREASFNWFVIVIMGFIVRLDHHGVTSFIRWLGLKPSLYTGLLSFFRASSWQLKTIQQKWWQIIWSYCPLLKIDNRYLLAGDGIKISKGRSYNRMRFRLQAIQGVRSEPANRMAPSLWRSRRDGLLACGKERYLHILPT